MPDDTWIGGAGARFPATHWSAIIAARSEDPAERRRAFDAIVRAYWKPVYKHIRVRWDRSNEDAKDLTQGFFAIVIEKGYLDTYDPARSRLRTFVRTCVDRFVQNEDKAARRLKRGAGALLSLDFEAAEGELARTGAPAAGSLEDFFEREWVRSLFALAVSELRARCEAGGREIQFRLFERYDLEDSPEPRPSYQDLAREFGIAVSDVTNHLAAARRGFRRVVLETLRDMTATDEEFNREARTLFGVTPE